MHHHHHHRKFAYWREHSTAALVVPKIIYILSFYIMFYLEVIKEICNPDVKSNGKYISPLKKKKSY